jgi:hypothetical protein
MVSIWPIIYNVLTQDNLGTTVPTKMDNSVVVGQQSLRRTRKRKPQKRVLSEKPPPQLERHSKNKRGAEGTLRDKRVPT